jgi:hypothetical protein
MRANSVNAYLFVWSAWLVLVFVIAYFRHKQLQRERQERQSRRQERDGHAETQVREVEPGLAQPRVARHRRRLSAEYRQQLIDAGILKPAKPEQSA